MKDKLTLQQYIELLPEVCASRLPSTGEVILIVRGSSGYYLAARDCDPDAFNELWGVTPAQVQAMEAGSMFGWDTPGANPDHTILGKYHYNKRIK